jgi:3-hydroxyisobutyrate dehydrogenase-like beta-hydroxyacid dehydrogenase
MLAKKVCVLYPGEMGAALGAALAAQGCEVFTWVGERRERTRDAAADSGFTRLPSFEQAVAIADVVLSLVPPGEALAVAQRFAAFADGRPEVAPLYLDANSVAPNAAREIAACVEAAGAECVDGVLVGGAARIGKETVLMLSGSRADELERAWRGALEIRALEGGVGAASSLKMAFSAFNKGLVALFLEAVSAAGQVGQADQLLHLFTDFYPGTVGTLERLLPSYPRHAARRVQEMREVESWLEEVGQSPVMARGTRVTFEKFCAAGLDPEESWSFARVYEQILQRQVLADGEVADAEGPKPS